MDICLIYICIEVAQEKTLCMITTFITQSTKSLLSCQFEQLAQANTRVEVFGFAELLETPCTNIYVKDYSFVFSATTHTQKTYIANTDKSIQSSHHTKLHYWINCKQQSSSADDESQPNHYNVCHGQ